MAGIKQNQNQSLVAGERTGGWQSRTRLSGSRKRCYRTSLPPTTWRAGSPETIMTRKTWRRRPACALSRPSLKAFEGFRGGDGRAWLLTIVRNTCYTWLRQNRMEDLTEVYDEEIHTVKRDSSNPETLLLESADAQLLRQALEELPVEFREVLVLRELEGMSYREIADLMSVPVGTVMSRLARGRERLERQLIGSARRSPERELPGE